MNNNPRESSPSTLYYDNFIQIFVPALIFFICVTLIVYVTADREITILESFISIFTGYRGPIIFISWMVVIGIYIKYGGTYRLTEK
jgi:hypothetical protein